MEIVQYNILLLLFFFSLLLFFPLLKYCTIHTTFYSKIILYVRYYIVKVFVYNFFDLIMPITFIFQKIMQEIRAPTAQNRITLMG